MDASGFGLPRAFRPVRVFGMRVWRVVVIMVMIMRVVMVVIMIVVVVMRVFQTAHACAKRIAQSAIGDI
jgi:hypothetical protein